MPTHPKSCCVYFGDNVTAGGATFKMTGGTFVSSEKTIRNMGTQSGDTVIDISGGTVVSTDGTALYVPANGEVNISGDAKIYSAKVGIEIRAGELNVTGGTIKTGTIDKTDVNNITVTDITTLPDGLKYKPSTDGNSADEGVAIAVVQHSTRKNIVANISGGTISGYTALAVINANGNKAFGETDTGNTRECW